ncbi:MULTISPECIES: winged helix-turn-helix domain-containing protein [Streptomycetaceae]|uniref:winged helix-turn-helix domain-containing protein n=1 Tax=unclassified Streptomyces TaxID=2593676 RepID=UPI0033D57D5E
MCHAFAPASWLFRVSPTVEGSWRLLRRRRWSRQQPATRAIERGDDVVEVWNAGTRRGPTSQPKDAVRR